LCTRWCIKILLKLTSIEYLRGAVLALFLYKEVARCLSH
jgi:hypothetical protein